MAAALDGRVSREILGQERTRADETHVPFNDVPELRKFVEACGAEEAAQGSEAKVVRQKIAGCVFGVCHGSEFIEPKRSILVPDSKLPKEYRAAQPEPNRYRCYDENRKQADQGNPGKKMIAQRFDEAAVNQLRALAYVIFPQKEAPTFPFQSAGRRWRPRVAGRL